MHYLNYKYEHQQVREDQVNQIIEYISKLEQSKFPIILCGDFNADPESDEIRKITGLTKPVNDIVLRDVWKLTNRNDPGYTWSNSNDWAKKTLEYNRRIDYIFLVNLDLMVWVIQLSATLSAQKKINFFQVITLDYWLIWSV